MTELCSMKSYTKENMQNMKTTEEKKNSEKEQLLTKVAAESVQNVIKAERSLRNR